MFHQQSPNGHFVVHSCFGEKRQNEQATKWNSISSFWRLLQRENTIKLVVCSFCRVGQGAKTNKQTTERHSKISFCRLFVLSPSPKHGKPIKRPSYRDILKFDFSWLLVRFVDFNKAPKRRNDNTTRWGFATISFCRFVAFHKTPKRTNDMAVSGFHRETYVAPDMFEYPVSNRQLCVWRLLFERINDLFITSWLFNIMSVSLSCEQYLAIITNTTLRRHCGFGMDPKITTPLPTYF